MTLFLCCVTTRKSTSYKRLYLAIISLRLEASRISFHPWNERKFQYMFRQLNVVIVCYILTSILKFTLVVADDSLLRSRFLGCHAMLHPKKRLLTTEPHSFPFVFVVCLHFVEQANHIIAKYEWRKISLVKASGFCFTPHAPHATKTGLCSWATIMTEEKKTSESKPQVQRLHALIAVRSVHDRIYVIFWKCLIVSVNLKASYRLETG